MNLSRHLLFVMIIAVSEMASAEPLGTVKHLLMTAISAPDGSASGVLDDQIARQMRTATGSPEPVMGEVTTMKDLGGDGCKRLTLHIRQGGVKTKQGKLTEFGIEYRLNLCRDGMPPSAEGK